MDFDELLKRSAAVSNAKYKKEYVKISDIETVRDLYVFNILVSNLVADRLMADFDYGGKELLTDFLRGLEQGCDISFKEWVDSARENGDAELSLDFLAYTYLCSNIVRHFDNMVIDKIDHTVRCCVSFNNSAKSTKPEEVAKRLFSNLDTLRRNDDNFKDDLELCCTFSFNGTTWIEQVLKSHFLEVKAKMSMYEVLGLDV